MVSLKFIYEGLYAPQLDRNNSDDIKLSLKTFLQGIKWCYYSINCEGLCHHYKVIYDQIFTSSVVIFHIIFEILYYLFLIYFISFLFNYNITIVQ